MSSTIQFFGGSSPALDDGTYTIQVQQQLGAPASSPPDQPPPSPLPSYTASQTFQVSGYEFTLPSTLIASQFPPDGGTDAYDQELPFIVLTDPYLPWERTIVPESVPAVPPQPWLALVIFTADEITFPLGSKSPISSVTVQQLLTAETNIVKPALDASTLSTSVLSSQCNTITIPASTFQNVLPQSTDLTLLAHQRSMNVPGEPVQNVSVVLCNRLPLASGSAVPYWAVLLSLEGFGDYLLPSPAITLDSSQSVQLVALASWSFNSLPEAAVNFESLAAGLVSSESATNGTLALPVPPQTPAGEVPTRLEQGYVPLNFHAFDSRTFAWYRGPFTPAPAETLPGVGRAGAPLIHATSSDSLLIYLAQQGLFDISYAAAWNLGRGLALANGAFSQAMLALRQQAAQSLALIAGRMSMEAFEAEDDPRRLLARGAARRQFLRLMGKGLGRRWNDSMATGPGARTPRRQPPRQEWRTLVQRADVVDAIAGNLTNLEAVAEFLAGLLSLSSAPFSYLVPNAAMLPPESIRFFFIDEQWTEALIAGAASIGIQSSLDLAMHAALWSRMNPSPAAAQLTGMLIQSQLVSDFPTMNITASAGGNPVDLMRDDTIGASVRLCLFNGVPDTVNLTEPYHSLLFGVQDNGVVLRNTTGTIGSLSGASLPPGPSPTFASFLTTYCTAGNGVIAVTALGNAMGVGSDAGNYAMQLIYAPEQVPFTAQS